MSPNQEFKSKQQRIWDEIWKRFEGTIRVGSADEYFHRVKLEFLLKLFPKIERCLTLECGCGGATISDWLSQLGHDTVAIDFSEEALSVAKNNFALVGVSGQFIICDVEHLPFRESVFDVVMSFGLFEHFTDPRPHTQEMIRVLRTEGLLFMDVVPKRFTIQTLADGFTKLSRVLRRKPLPPRYFEIQMDARQLKEFFEPFALQDLKVVGNRPFPILGKKLDRIYLLLVRKLRWLYNRFDGSWVALRLGCGLWVYGFKATASGFVGRSES